MIEKVMVFFSTYNIIVGLVITIVSLFSVELIRSFTNDILIPVCKHNIETHTIKIKDTDIRIGLFYTSLLRLLIALFIICIIIHIYSLNNNNI